MRLGTGRAEAKKKRKKEREREREREREGEKSRPAKAGKWIHLWAREVIKEESERGKCFGRECKVKLNY